MRARIQKKTPLGLWKNKPLNLHPSSCLPLLYDTIKYWGDPLENGRFLKCHGEDAPDSTFEQVLNRGVNVAGSSIVQIRTY